ncbi:lysozyme inhibitor LprI family protein [Rhizobium sp.]
MANRCEIKPRLSASVEEHSHRDAVSMPHLSISEEIMIKSAMVAATFLFAVTTATAASFDCDKASTPDEKAICDTRNLNDADVRMSTMFDLATRMAAMGERDDLRAAQTRWLETRAKCNGDLACLKGAYDQRISELDKTFLDFEERAAP